VPGPAVLEWIHWAPGDVRWVGDVYAGAVGQAHPVPRGAGPSDREVPRGGEGHGRTVSNPVYQFDHKERKDDVANQIRQQRGEQDGITFIGVAQKKAQAFPGQKVAGQFQFTRDKTAYVNHYYFYLEDADFGPLFIKVCRYAPWGTKLCLNGHGWAKRQWKKKGIA
jgi:hypothetical protein